MELIYNWISVTDGKIFCLLIYVFDIQFEWGLLF
jgi:hypothetical protein